MKRKLALLLAIVLMFTTISGCSQKDVSPKPDDSSTTPQETTGELEVPTLPDEDVTLTFMGSAHLVSVAEVVLEDYLKEHPNVKINFEKYSYAEYPTKLKVQLSNKEDTPDIMVIHSEFATQFAKAGWLKDLTPMIPEDDVLMPMLKNISVDDKIYGLSNQASNFFTFMYRKDIYDQYGLTPPATWDEYYEQALFLKDKGYYSGAVFPSDALEPFMYYIYMLGGCVFDNDGNVVFDKGVEALELLKKGLDAGIFHNSKQGSSESGKGEYWTAFNDGLIAAFPGKASDAAYYETNTDPEGKGGFGHLAVAPAMKFSEEGPDTFTFNTSYFVINENTKHAEAAKHVLAYLALSEEACLKFSNVSKEGLLAKYTTGYLPAIRNIAENGSEGWPAFGDQEVITELAKQLLKETPLVPYRDERSAEANAIITTVLGETLVDNKYTPEEAIAEMIRQIEAI